VDTTLLVRPRRRSRRSWRGQLEAVVVTILSRRGVPPQRSWRHLPRFCAGAVCHLRRGRYKVLAIGPQPNNRAGVFTRRLAMMSA
jgi:hypothetical protein